MRVMITFFQQVQNLSFDDEFVEEYLTKWEFRRSYPDLIIGLIERSNKTALELYNIYKKVRSFACQKLDNLKNYIHVYDSETCSEDESAIPIGSVDGSMVTLKGFGDRWFVVYGVSIVIFPEGVKSFGAPEINVSVYNEFIGSGEDPVKIKRKAVITMMTGETKAIRSIISDRRMRNGIIFIDGPIIDPPTVKDREYISYRVDSFKLALVRHNEIVGIVKRYSSKLFLGNVLGNSLGVIAQNDRFFIPIIFNLYRQKFDVAADSSLYTTPFKLCENLETAVNSEVFRLYEETLTLDDINIYGMYFQHKLGVRSLKVEFFAEDDSDAQRKAKRIVSILRRTMVPGTYLPLPIILSHETSLIRRRVAKALFSNAISKFISEASDYDIIYDLITYE